MRELKYYKDLPVRSINKVHYPLMVAGADCYIDVQGNKYAFISFRNAGKKPFFSLYLYIKEYNAAGSLIKETKFSMPNTYGRRGLFITPEPVAIEQECEGIEVFISLAEFTGKTFYNDYWTKQGAEKINITPSVTSTSSVPFEVQPTKEELLKAEAEENGVKAEEAPVVEEPIKEESKVEEPVKEEAKEEEKPVEKAAPERSSSLASGSNFYHEEAAEEVAEEEKPAEEAKAEETEEEPKEEEKPVEEEVKLPPVTETKVYDRSRKLIFPILLGILLVIAIVYIIVDYVAVYNRVEELWFQLERHFYSGRY